jgi:hypothetical protein
MLMENTLQARDRQNMKYIFDLKGSIVDRKIVGKTQISTTLKDVNFIVAKKYIPNLTTLPMKVSR